jgi:hypothetical protein
VAEKTFIQIDGQDIKIENYKIDNYCEIVDKIINEEENEEEFVIHSKAIISITKDGEKANVPVDIQIIMDDVFEIYEMNFIPSIY